MCDANIAHSPPTGMNGPEGATYSAAAQLSNCGNCSTGSTSLVAVSRPASSIGLSATAGPPNRASRPVSGSAMPVIPSAATGVRS
jgi:hypothetical protein